jgi:integrase/recombinase XerD
MIKQMLEIIDKYLTAKEYELTDSTRYSYGYALKKFSDWMESSRMDVQDVNPQTVAEFLRSHGWANNTKRLFGNAIKSFMFWYRGQSSPLISLKLPRDNAAPGRYLEPAQADRLLSHFDTTTPRGWRDLAMVALMLESGLRESEVCRLDLKYLDVGKNRFYVLQKGQTWREGIFSEQTARFLDMWLTARQTIAVAGCTTVFVGIGGNTPGRKMTPGGLRKLFRRYGKAAGIGLLSPHDLRRSMATLLTENGAPTRTVQILGGWSDIRMVERYTRKLKPEDIERWSPVCRRLDS